MTGSGFQVLRTSMPGSPSATGGRKRRSGAARGGERLPGVRPGTPPRERGARGGDAPEGSSPARRCSEGGSGGVGAANGGGMALSHVGDAAGPAQTVAGGFSGETSPAAPGAARGGPSCAGDGSRPSSKRARSPSAAGADEVAAAAPRQRRAGAGQKAVRDASASAAPAAAAPAAQAGRRPTAAASDPARALTHGITLMGAQLSWAILHGHKTLENRSISIPPGWYAVHTGKGKLDAAHQPTLSRVRRPSNARPSHLPPPSAWAPQRARAARRGRRWRWRRRSVQCAPRGLVCVGDGAVSAGWCLVMPPPVRG